MPSLASRLMTLVVSMRGSKRRYSSVDRTAAHVVKMASRPASHKPPKSLQSKVTISLDETSTWPVYQVSPRGRTPDRAAVYFHGGAYLWEITSFHWRIIADLAARTETTFFVPIYPLAPSATAATTVPTATAISADVIEQYGSDRVTLMGDSAGGGMTLAVAQRLRDASIAHNGRIILISPWLDVSMTDPAIEGIAGSDPWLAVPGVTLAGELYRGELPENDPLVSPLCGDLRNLAPITLFSGTRDIANADALSLVRRAHEVGVAVEYFEAPGMLHVYPLLPIPEGKRARVVIADLLAAV